MNFICPKCKATRIEEIIDNAVVATEVLGVEDGGSTEYAEPSVSDGATDRFQCLNCGWELPICERTTPDTEELYEWLKENKML